MSLLVHGGQVVYVSENLPRMDRLRGAPTRPLDGFEAAALEKLRHGEHLLVTDAPEELEGEKVDSEMPRPTLEEPLVSVPASAMTATMRTMPMMVPSSAATSTLIIARRTLPA